VRKLEASHAEKLQKKVTDLSVKGPSDLTIKEMSTPSIVELRELPKHLQYVFLG
jgi:hypothetical protein